jgi:hypothetical protein
LLEDNEVANSFHVLTIQEPWRNPQTPTTYSPASCNFHVTCLDSKHTREAVSINNGIDPSLWEVDNLLLDLAILRRQFQDPEDQNQTKTYTIYKVYNPGPESMTSINGLSLTTGLNYMTLEKRGWNT